MIKVAVVNPDKAGKDGMYSYVTIPVGEINAFQSTDEASKYL